MNKHTNLLGILGLTVLDTHSNIMGKGAHVRMTEEQLDQVEAALVANDTSSLQKTITAHEATITGMQDATISVSTALDAAFTLNGLTAVEGSTVADQIAQLGTQCKAYGDSNATHSIPPTDGLDKGEGAQETVYEFEKVLYDNSKFQTL